jgi:nicotinate-nucleotide adenylyltransferase
MGADSFQNLSQWKNYESLIRDYDIYVYPRQGFSTENKIGARLKIINAPLLQLSATYIRNCIAQNKSIRYLVPDAVIDEIEKGGYYRK